MKTLMAIIATAILSSLLSAFAVQQTRVVSNQWEFREQVSFNDRILLADGTTAAPSVAAIGDLGTGLSWPAANQLAFSSGGNDLGVWSVATGTLTATQVRTLNATPVEVIASPGAGFAIQVESVRFHLDFASVAYDSVGTTEDLALKYDSANNTHACHPENCLNGDASADSFGLAKTPIGGEGRILNAATAVQVTILVGEWADTDNDSDGDSPVHYLIRYRVVNVDLS